jgi:uncharacterized protein (TIGR00725 family)
MAIPGLMSEPRHIVTVFGSSRPQPDDPEYTLAYSVGEHLARAGFTVCNGGYGGTMEASARGAKDAGGRTLGITCDFLACRNANRWIDEIVNEGSMVDRLLKLVSVADAYVILKGGTGTLLELAAVWEFMNKNIISHKPIVIVGSFWNGVVRTLNEELAWEGLENCTRFVSVVSSPAECVSILQQQLRTANP